VIAEVLPGPGLVVLHVAFTLHLLFPAVMVQELDASVSVPVGFTALD
jgi:hypothetical protein